jgi:hypothetical protein
MTRFLLDPKVKLIVMVAVLVAAVLGNHGHGGDGFPSH